MIDVVRESQSMRERHEPMTIYFGKSTFKHIFFNQDSTVYHAFQNFHVKAIRDVFSLIPRLNKYMLGIFI